MVFSNLSLVLVAVVVVVINIISSLDFVECICYESRTTSLAFVHRGNPDSVFATTTHHQRGMMYPKPSNVGTKSSSLALSLFSSKQAEKKAEKKPKTAVDPDANNILRLLSPLNPYMLFVYPIIFIFAVDFFKLGPSYQ